MPASEVDSDDDVERENTIESIEDEKRVLVNTWKPWFFMALTVSAYCGLCALSMVKTTTKKIN
jgi:hypothetical protein